MFTRYDLSKYKPINPITTGKNIIASITPVTYCFIKNKNETITIPIVTAIPEIIILISFPYFSDKALLSSTPRRPTDAPILVIFFFPH